VTPGQLVAVFLHDAALTEFPAAPTTAVDAAVARSLVVLKEPRRWVVRSSAPLVTPG